MMMWEFVLLYFLTPNEHCIFVYVSVTNICHLCLDLRHINAIIPIYTFSCAFNLEIKYLV